jgi:hypothetical protein
MPTRKRRHYLPNSPPVRQSSKYQQLASYEVANERRNSARSTRFSCENGKRAGCQSGCRYGDKGPACRSELEKLSATRPASKHRTRDHLTSPPHHCTAGMISNRLRLAAGETSRSPALQLQLSPGAPVPQNRVPGLSVLIPVCDSWLRFLRPFKTKPRDTLRGFDKATWGVRGWGLRPLSSRQVVFGDLVPRN